MQTTTPSKLEPQAGLTAEQPGAPSKKVAPAPVSEWTPRFNPWLIAMAVMLGTFMEVLDTSVANVALPYIAGSLSASNDEATWVLTSYLVANAVILPASAWFGRRFGRKRFLLVCIGLFTLSSALCGAASSLGMLVLSRILQGAGGGALQPVAQAVLSESFPPAKRGLAMAVYGLGIVVAPIIGPTLGGWVTDNFSWRWIFYLNLPIGLAAIAAVRAFVEDPPYLRRSVAGRLDVLGFTFLTLWIGALQIILDKGQEVDWFSVSWMRWAGVVLVLGLIAFVAWELWTSAPLVDLRVLRNSNLATGTIMITVMGMLLYSLSALLPLFLQTLMAYPAMQSGWAVSPRGVGSVLGMLAIAPLMKRFDSRFLVGVGFALMALGTFVLGNLTLDVGPASVMWPQVLSGLSIAFVFVPLTTLSFGTLSPEKMGDGTGIFNLMRNIGGSIGISLATTMVARSSLVHQNLLSGHMTPLNGAFVESLQGLQTALSSTAQAYGAMYQGLLQQSGLFAYVDTFRSLALLALLTVPLVLMLKKSQHATPIMAH